MIVARIAKVKRLKRFSLQLFLAGSDRFGAGEGRFAAMPLRLALLIIILTLNAFFAAGEVALVSSSRSRLRAAADQGNVGAGIALSLVERPERLLSVSQVGLTLASLGLGWAGEETVYELIVAALNPVITPVTDRLIHLGSFVLAFLVISFLHIIMGEVIPKNLALEKPERVAMLLSPAFLVFGKISAPFVYIVEKAAAGASRALGFTKGGHGSGGHSIEELKFILASSRVEGHLENFEEEAIQKLLELKNIYAREIMVPRNTILSVPVESTLDEILKIMVEHKYSRVPVYEGSAEKIVGILHYKDLMSLWQERKQAFEHKRNARPFRIRRYLRKPLFVPETKPLSQLIGEFRENHTHMGVVVNEFGTISGLVTLEDLFEQVFGEIWDEHDQRMPKPRAEAALVEVEGTIPIRDLISQYQIDLPGDAGFETLAGFLLFKLGYVPRAGEEIEYNGRRFSILEMERNRIARVRIERIEEVA